ncbi:MAG: uracil-DNA glycosylase [Pseudomonadota bacterium]
MSDRAALLAALAWQLDLGADEAITDHPQDRFAESQPKAPATGTAGAAPRATTRATGAAVAARRGGDGDLFPGPAASAEPGGETAPAAPLAAAAKSLPELAEALASWQGSDLRKGARNCVFADGQPGAPVMIIGEAPGADEDRQGKPFVGRAGQLLDRMLAAIGLDRAAEDPAHAVYITNILPWRPPGNRTPSDREVTAFLPFVLRHIELVGPRILFTIGNTPTKALMNTTIGIRRMRGQWQTHQPSGLPLLPSFHPAYLLRQPAEKRHAWRDLLSLRAALDDSSGGT